MEQLTILATIYQYHCDWICKMPQIKVILCRSDVAGTNKYLNFPYHMACMHNTIKSYAVNSLPVLAHNGSILLLVSYLCSSVMHTYSLVLEVLAGIHHYNTVYGGREEAYKANYSHAEGRDGSKWSAVTARLAAICTFTCKSCKIRYREARKGDQVRVDEYNYNIPNRPLTPL